MITWEPCPYCGRTGHEIVLYRAVPLFICPKGPENLMIFFLKSKDGGLEIAHSSDPKSCLNYTKLACINCTRGPDDPDPSAHKS